MSVERGGRIFLLPAVASVLGMCCVGLLPGVQGLWTDSFRVGPLWDETVSMPGVPELRGIRLDPTTAGLINDTREVLRREGFLGKPGFSTSNGTGLTYAVGMPGPLSGLFVEEPLPDVLRVRIREACRIGAIDPGHPPVVLSIGATRPEVATTELQSCGINFPGAYRAVRVPVVDGGFLFMRKDGITVWLPNG